MGKGSSNNPGECIEGDEIPVLVLKATLTLTKTCNVKQLKKIPVEIREIFLSYLKELWGQVRDQRNTEDCSKERRNIIFIVEKHDLAESIFRLSTCSDPFTTTWTPEVVKRNIFGPKQPDYEHFIFNYWENTPFILRKASKHLDDHDNIFSSFFPSDNCKTTLDVILPSFLAGLVCCPPLPSDELDVLNFLTELEDRLGHPIIYGQDIRILKAVEVSLGSNQGNMKREVHFLECTGSSCISAHNFMDNVDVQKCRIAYQEGYTIALRGLEFRSEKIASFADGLALLFGQPSAGANAYLTPPRSQGLAQHYDDHCVFVYQLLGQKRWTVFPQSTSHLPRLYEHLDNLLGPEGDIVASKCKQYLLGEGDILYIPRGCRHEACTIADAESEVNHASTEFSFHLTFGIEVEPPFEWEGFAHNALHCWNQKKNQPPYKSANPFLHTLNFMSIHFLHVAIQLIGGLDSTFAKACMVAAFSRDESNALIQKQRSTFSYIISVVDRKASFLEVIKSIAVAIQEKNENKFQRMRWLRHLYSDGDDTKKGLDWDNLLIEFNNLFRLCNEHRHDAETTFMLVKSKFCNEVIFEDVCDNYEKLLHKYRKARTQYMNGMLSLHCTSAGS